MQLQGFQADVHQAGVWQTPYYDVGVLEHAVAIAARIGCDTVSTQTTRAP